MILLTSYSFLQELEQLAKNATMGFPDLETYMGHLTLN